MCILFYVVYDNTKEIIMVKEMNIVNTTSCV